MKRHLMKESARTRSVIAVMNKKENILIWCYSMFPKYVCYIEYWDSEH